MGEGCTSGGDLGGRAKIPAQRAAEPPCIPRRGTGGRQSGAAGDLAGIANPSNGRHLAGEGARNLWDSRGIRGCGRNCAGLSGRSRVAAGRHAPTGSSAAPEEGAFVLRVYGEMGRDFADRCRKFLNESGILFRSSFELKRSSHDDNGETARRECVSAATRTPSSETIATIHAGPRQRAGERRESQARGRRERPSRVRRSAPSPEGQRKSESES